jgi:hypothetical protein
MAPKPAWIFGAASSEQLMLTVPWFPPAGVSYVSWIWKLPFSSPLPMSIVPREQRVPRDPQG